MKKKQISENFFDFESKENIWDVGFPMSPRKFLFLFIGIVLLTLTVVNCVV